MLRSANDKNARGVKALTILLWNPKNSNGKPSSAAQYLTFS